MEYIHQTELLNAIRDYDLINFKPEGLEEMLHFNDSKPPFFPMIFDDYPDRLFRLNRRTEYEGLYQEKYLVEVYVLEYIDIDDGNLYGEKKNIVRIFGTATNDQFRKKHRIINHKIRTTKVPITEFSLIENAEEKQKLEKTILEKKEIELICDIYFDDDNKIIRSLEKITVDAVEFYIPPKSPLDVSNT